MQMWLPWFNIQPAKAMENLLAWVNASTEHEQEGIHCKDCQGITFIFDDVINC